VCCNTIIATAAQFEQVEKLFANATREMRRDRSLNFIDRPASLGGSPKGSSQAAPVDSLCQIFDGLAVIALWTHSHCSINEMNL
jgi:hypothetical protein